MAQLGYGIIAHLLPSDNERFQSQMDFFETRERYRRQEVNVYMRRIIWVVFLSLAVWLGWHWGGLEQRQLSEDADQALYESTQDVLLLRRQLDKLQLALNEWEAAERTRTLEDAVSDTQLSQLIKAQLANGTEMEQIYAAVQNSGRPNNCKMVLEQDIAVATEHYTGSESQISLFDGGLRLSFEGEADARGTKSTPWFNAEAPISIRLVYLGGQRIETETVPFDLVVPAESWLLRLTVGRAALPGYVKLRVRSCRAR